MSSATHLKEKYSLSLPKLCTFTELFHVKKDLMAKANMCSSKSWVKKSNSRYDCRLPNCKAKCMYKKFEKDLFVLNKYIAHTCNLSKNSRLEAKIWHWLMLSISQEQ
jgi:hypothetical protein